MIFTRHDVIRRVTALLKIEVPSDYTLKKIGNFYQFELIIGSKIFCGNSTVRLKAECSMADAALAEL